MRYIFLIIAVLIFSGCFGEEEKKTVKKIKKKVKKEPVKELVKKVKINGENNESFSDTIEADGIVVDGARDEELLDAFGLAVSQIMTEEGVSVPDCTAIAKTEYLTKEECDEISEKYFGFYDIYTIDGTVKKVEDVFEQGISGEAVEIRDEQIEYFDSSGNPLLDNLVEFEEFVEDTSNEEVLEDLLSKIPKNKLILQKKVKEKLEFIKALSIAPLREKERQNFEKELEKERLKIENEIQQAENEALSNGLSVLECSSKKSSLASLTAKFKKIESTVDAGTDNEKLIDEYNELQINISTLEAEIVGCK
jgi:hypothetical protein